MTRTERLARILAILEEHKASTVPELAGELDVSHMTVRRDLVSLVDDERVKILHGSVILHPKSDSRSVDSYYSLIAAGSLHRKQKRAIGALAASLVEPDDALIIDSGSTTGYLAKELPSDRPYSALSYSLNVLSETVRRKNCRTLFAGGVFHDNTLMFEGPEALDMIRRYRASKAFISSAGLSAQFGVTCMNPYERETKLAVMQSSLRKILLVDSSKFGVVRSEWFANLSDFDELVTDSSLGDDDETIIRGMGIRLHIARV